MATTCKKCGATATGDQAFCSKCGAVIGMEGTPEGERPTPPNLGATVVGQRFNIPPPKPKTQTPEQTPSAPPAGAQGAAATTRPTPPRDANVQRGEAVAARASGGSKAALLVVAGFIAVLLIGGLLLLLVYIFFGGGHL